MIVPKSSQPQPEDTYLLNESETAQILCLSVSTLRAHRFQRKGMPYVKLGRSVRYRQTDIAAYTDANIVIPGGKNV